MAAVSNRLVSVEGLVQEFECPVLRTVYTRENPCVSLVTCGHAVSQNFAQRILAGPEGSLERRCPICREAVVSSVPNYAVMNIMERVLHRPSENEAIPLVSAQIERAPAIDVAAIPFPGVGAHFELVRKWRSGGDRSIAWVMEFKSMTEGSFFTGFEVFGTRMGKIQVALKAGDDSLRTKYLLDCGMILDFEAHFIGCVNAPSDVKKVFRHVAAHNQFPEPEYSLIRRLIQGNIDWRTSRAELGIEGLR